MTERHRTCAVFFLLKSLIRGYVKACLGKFAWIKSAKCDVTVEICTVILNYAICFHIIFFVCMKWIRYQRVISLKIQVGNTNQRNKWANTDPRIYQRWNQVPRRSKHSLLIDHTRREPSSMIMNAELSAVKVSVPSTV
jgi:hypothetical protein